MGRRLVSLHVPAGCRAGGGGTDINFRVLITARNAVSGLQSFGEPDPQRGSPQAVKARGLLWRTGDAP